MIHPFQFTIRYIRERRCQDGGYCFYRLNEPNASDTYYALASLQMLDSIPEDDEDTLSFLHTFQREDGSFSNVYVGYAVIRSLILLGDKPSRDPSDWILSSLLPPSDRTRPIESSSGLWQLYLLTSLCRCLGITLPEKRCETIGTAVRSQRSNEGGFGSQSPTMAETSHALSILHNLGYPVAVPGSELFIQRCEDLEYGFLPMPGVRPSYLEDVHAGLLASSILGYCSPMIQHCASFIRRCYHANGGYVRSIFGGSTTLENTYYALDALRMIRISRNDNAEGRSDLLIVA